MLTLLEYATDVSAIYTLLKKYESRFLQSNEVLDEPWVNHLVSHETLWTITQNTRLVGVIWWEALVPGQSAIIHLVIQPSCVRLFWRQQLGRHIVQRAISTWQLKRLFAQFEAHRRQPPKWLAKLGFVPTPSYMDNQWLWTYLA